MIWNDDVLAELREIKHMLWQSRQRELNLEGILMTIKAEVQALLDAVKEQSDAIASATDEIVSLETHVSALEAKLAEIAALPAGDTVDAENLAGIVQATGSIRESIAKIKAVMPQPVEPAVVTAVADAPQ